MDYAVIFYQHLDNILQKHLEFRKFCKMKVEVTRRMWIMYSVDLVKSFPTSI